MVMGKAAEGVEKRRKVFTLDERRLQKLPSLAFFRLCLPNELLVHTRYYLGTFKNFTDKSRTALRFVCACLCVCVWE